MPSFGNKDQEIASPQEEADRACHLREAETKAIALFDALKPLIQPSKLESKINSEIYELGVEQGVRTHWHKRIVRGGPNTLCPFAENPPDRELEADDIVIIDLGPVFEAWEADFGRTYVLGSDPRKLALRDALEPTWYAIKQRYDERPSMTGEELYAIGCEEARKRGYEWGADIAGHIVGDFPHERIPNDRIGLYITPGCKVSMTDTGKGGCKRHWILEVHLRDPQLNRNGFFEQLLTVP
ncbi:Creatinase/aminopeptidase [Piedraia hortae CBS 480.64]|uniref:Creatinase/aminopeptidase n=1 Tax=Piedraia hortae CBS 480.64 TaxID=1314780 RepID=A0A6A7C4Q4_9PEZI|nr:Creatinase/aminopeptidase [Piedraia hortae CBS 480.64]